MKVSTKQIFLFFYVVLFILLLSNMLMNRSFWMDESYSFLHAQRSLENVDEMGYNLLSPVDAHPPAYYVVLHYWMKLTSESTMAIRSLSVLFGLGCFVMLFFIIDYKFKLKKSEKKTLLLIFFFLYVFSTTNLQYFTEARMYAMGLFFCLVSLYSLMKLHLGEKYFWTFLISTGIAIFSHYYAIFFIAGEFVYFYLFYRGKDRGKAFIIWLIPLILSICAGLFLIQQRLRIKGFFFATSGWSSMLSTYFYSFFHSNSGSVSNINTILGYIFLIISIGVIIYYLKHVEIKEKKFASFLLLWYLCSILVGMAISIFVTKAYHHRFFFFEGWIIILLLARSITFLLDEKRFSKFMVASLILVFVIVVYVSNITDYFGTQQTELRDISKIVEQSKLLVIHESSFSWLSAQYYLGSGRNFLYTNLDEGMLRTAAGDVIPKRFIFRDEKQLYELDEFLYYSFIYYGESEISNLSGFKYDVVWEKGGLRLMHARKFNNPPVITRVGV